MERPNRNHVRIAKEFIKFNERCFVRLLGDMRSYNYVVEVTPDFEDEQYRVRAIDFDQQSYEGRKNVYLPQFFKENLPVVKLCTNLLNLETMRQYQQEERTLMARRFTAAGSATRGARALHAPGSALDHGKDRPVAWNSPPFIMTTPSIA